MTGGVPRRRKVRRFTAERRAEFLGHLRRTGNQTAAAQALGFDRTVPEQRRRRDAQFELECRAAEAEAHRRLAGATDAFDHPGDVRFETLRRGRGGRMQIVASRRGKWSKAVEDMFLEVLRGCGNIAASARAIGFSESLIWHRRRQWPAFAQRMEEALEEAELALEFRLVALGSNVGARMGGGMDPDGGMTPPLGADGEPVADALAAGGEGEFDPEFALRFLKWREEKRRGPATKGKTWRRPRSLDEMRESILAKMEAIEAMRQQEQRAEGWSQDEQGRMIPPGWVRGAPEPDEAA